jgi:hypothetical protein
VTCISTLLPAERLECEVLQARDFGLEEAQVHDRLAAVVLPLEDLHAGAFDVEDRHPPAIHAPDLDAGELTATREPEGSEEEVLGLEHRRLPCRWHALDSPRRVGYRWVGSR